MHQEQVLAANVDTVVIVAALTRDLNLRRLERYLTLAWASGAAPVVLLNKADLCDDLPARLAEVRPIAGDAPVLTSSAVARRGARRARAVPRARPDRGPAGLVGRRQVDHHQRAPGRRAPARPRRPRGRLARAPHDHRPGAVRAARRRAAHRHPGHALAGALRRPTTAWTWRSRTSRHSPPNAASATAPTRWSPAARCGAAIEAGELTADRLRARRKLQRELGIVAKAADAAARRANARTWGKISREASDAAARKRGGLMTAGTGAPATSDRELPGRAVGRQPRRLARRSTCVPWASRPSGGTACG